MENETDTKRLNWLLQEQEGNGGGGGGEGAPPHHGEDPVTAHRVCANRSPAGRFHWFIVGYSACIVATCVSSTWITQYHVASEAQNCSI